MPRALHQVTLPQVRNRDKNRASEPPDGQATAIVALANVLTLLADHVFSSCLHPCSIIPTPPNGQYQCRTRHPPGLRRSHPNHLIYAPSHQIAPPHPIPHHPQYPHRLQYSMNQNQHQAPRLGPGHQLFQPRQVWSQLSVICTLNREHL